MKRTWTSIGVSVGIVAALVVVGIVLLAREDPPIRSRATLPEDTSCLGEPTTLDEITLTMPFPIFLAHTPLANPANIEHVLICGVEQVEIGYSSGALVTLGVNHLDDPQAEWASLAEIYPEFSTGTVRGVPASLADPDKGALGGVDLVEDGVRITVTGNGEIPLPSLVEVAESLSATQTPSVTASA
jgi:hypothetical protein